jgi:hypothetical protein
MVVSTIKKYLNYRYLDGNKLKGEIPATIGSLVNLKHLYELLNNNF